MSRRNKIRRTLESLEPRAMLAWKVLEAGEQLVIGEPNDGDTGVLSYDPELNEYVLDGVATGVEVEIGGSQANVVIRTGNADETTFVFDDSEMKFPGGISCAGPGCYSAGIHIDYDGRGQRNNLTVASESQVRVQAAEPEAGTVVISSEGRHRIAYTNLGGTLHFDGAGLIVDARQTENRDRWVTVEAGSIKVREFIRHHPPIATVVTEFDIVHITYDGGGRLKAIYTGDGNDRVNIASSFVADMNTRKLFSEILRISTAEGDDTVSITGTPQDDWIWLAEWPQGCPSTPFDPGFDLPSCDNSLSLVSGIITDPFVPGQHIPRLVEHNFANPGGFQIHPRRQFATFKTIGVEAHVVSGGDGEDILIGSDGADLLWGGPGNDKLLGRGGDDAIVGGSGTDSISGGDGNDSLIAGEMAPLGEIRCSGAEGGFRCDIPFPSRWFGTDLFFIDPAIDTLGDDILLGGAGDDEMFGSAGANLLDAGPGNDILSGGGGNDQLNGGLGRNVMIAGTGRDSVHSLGSDLVITGSTEYDVDAESLRAIRAEWNSSRSLAQRIANLQTGASEDRANGDTFLNDSTLLGDSDVDRVYARRSVDWLLTDDGDLISVPGVPPRDRRDRPRLPLRAIVERRGLPVPPQQPPANLLAQYQTRRLER